MKKKIYNKKGLLGGVFMLILGIVGIYLYILPPNGHISHPIKSLISTVLCLLFGITGISRSFDKKASNEDINNDDEREKLISIKAGNTTCIITGSICFVMAIILAFLNKNEFKFAMAAFFLVPSMMITIWFFSSLYHEWKN